LVRFILSKNYERPAEIGSIETNGVWLFCGETALQATIEEQYFMVRCSACDRPTFAYRVRPAQVQSHTGDEIVESVIWEQAGDLLKTRQGVCPDCGGKLETTVEDASGSPHGDSVPVSFAAVSECQHCLRQVGIPLPYAAAYHPDAVAFHWEHGVDILGSGFWEFHPYLLNDRWTAEFLPSESEEYCVEFEHGPTMLRVYLDDTATVTRTERVQTHGQRERRK
jgi:hypothetical protein